WIEQTMPRSVSSLVTVFLDTPSIRQVARIELPSTSAPTMAARFSPDNLFIVTIMLEKDREVKLQKPLPRPITWVEEKGCGADLKTDPAGDAPASYPESLTGSYASLPINSGSRRKPKRSPRSFDWGLLFCLEGQRSLLPQSVRGTSDALDAPIRGHDAQ